MGRSKDKELQVVEYRNVDGFKISSRVIDYPKAWSERGFLVVHEPARRDYDFMVKALDPKNFDPASHPWKVDNFFKWYNDYHYPIIHHHHDIEEKIYFPDLKKAGVKIESRVADDHKKLLELMAKIQDMESRFANASREEAHKAADDLYDLVRELVDHMLPHLDEEEELFEQIAKRITEKEHGKLTQKILKSFTIADHKKMVPWIVQSYLEWSDEEELKKQLWNNMPPPIRSIAKNRWVPFDAQTRIPLMESLFSKEEQNPFRGPPPPAGCCTIV